MPSTLCALLLGFLCLSGINCQDPCSEVLTVPVITTYDFRSPFYETGEISPAYPCNILKIDFETAPGTTITMTCEEFNMNCLHEPFIYAFTASSPLTQVCGTTFPGVTTTTNTLRVTLTSVLNHYGVSEIRLPMRFKCTIQRNGEPVTTTTTSTTTTTTTTTTPEGACDCGTRLPEFSNDKIAGGENAAEGEFPFQVALWNRRYLHYCGATLISERYIVTAASCNPKRRHFAVLGKRDQREFSINDLYPIIEVLQHPLYDETTKQWNLALAKLDKDVIFTDTIRPICLPDNYQGLPFTGSLMSISGWGSTQTSGQGSAVLQKATVAAISNAQCSSFGGIFTGKIFGETICTQGHLNADACNGDFGGPLAFLDGRMYLIGVTSFGNACAQDGTPTGHMRVSNSGILAWIKFFAGIECDAP